MKNILKISILLFLVIVFAGVLHATKNVDAVTTGNAFSSSTLTVVLHGYGGGSVVSNPSGISCTKTSGQSSTTCSGTFISSSTVILTAFPTTSTSLFAGWSSGCTMVSSTNCFVSLDQNRTVTAKFDLLSKYKSALRARPNLPPTSTIPTLTTILYGTGKGRVISSPSGIDCSSASSTPSASTTSCSAIFSSSTLITLRAISLSGSSFGGWGGCEVIRGTVSRCKIRMDSDKTVTARFNSTVASLDQYSDQASLLRSLETQVQALAEQIQKLIAQQSSY